AGSGFDPATAEVLFTGPGCLPCAVTIGQLSVTSTSITGVTNLIAAGSYTVAVQNSLGLPSNTVNITVSAVGLSISSIALTPNPPVAGQSFSFAITGAGFDLSNAQVSFSGTGCSPCSVAHSLLSVTSTSITG